MKPTLTTKVCTVLITGLTLYAASGRADTFDWNNITYAPANAAAAGTQTSIGNSSNGTNSAKIQFTLNGGATFISSTTAGNTYQSPISASYSQNNNVYASGGGADTQKALQIAANFSANPANANILVTIVFAKPVVSVSFNFFDVDIQATVTNGTQTYYNDRLSSIQGSLNGGTPVIPTVTNTGSNTNTVSGNTVTGANAANPQNSAGGNATITFGATQSIDQISFVYDSAYRGADPATGELIAMSNITFANAAVPEPGTLAMLGLGVFGAAGAALRRRS